MIKSNYRFVYFSVCCFVVVAFFNGCKTETVNPIYLDTDYSFEERAADLVSRLTLEEKQSLLGNTMPAVPRLGINPYYVWGEALHGVVPMFNPNEAEATSFPSSTALASSWDPELMKKEAIAISDEARAFNNPVIANLTYWSPVIEPARDPRWGRTAETYGEDPFLISQIGSAFIRGMMGDDSLYLKTIPCGKHYFANNSEFNRHIGSSDMDDRDMREYYLVPYKNLIEKDKLPSIMTCYNAVNGIPMSANRYYVDTIPRKTYGLQGYVTGDCGAIQDIQTGHHYVETAAEAAAAGLKSGVDTDCGSVYQTSAIDALNRGLITEADMDIALVNMFTTRMRAGEFDPPSSVPYSNIGRNVVNSPEHVALAAEIAGKTPVLLKNNVIQNSDKKILPLNASGMKKIALIGPQVNKVELGPYSGRPLEENMITPLEGIEKLLDEKAATVEIVWTEGANTISDNNLFSVYWFEIEKKDGSVERYDASRPYSTSPGITIGSGLTPETAVKSIIDKDWTSYRNVNISDIQSVNISMTIPGSGGSVEFRAGSPSGTVIATVDGRGTTGMYSAFMPSTLSAEAVQTGLVGNQTLYLVYRAPEKPPIEQETIDMAASADVVVLFVGTDDHTMNEEADRLTLELPGNQYELIDAVAEANPNTVVVMQTHGMVEVDRFKDNPNIAGIIWTGFNGQAQGTAIASILFGDINPGGKLNSTWYRSLRDLPPITDYELRGGRNKNGRTFWYFNKDVSYEFGYGLSYTSFEYSNFSISKDEISPNDKITVSVDVKNTGDVDGDEVVQIYMKTPESPASLERPAKRLKGFQKVFIKAGETKTVPVDIDCADLWFWDSTGDRLIFDQGKYIFEIGSSSEDIRGKVETVMNGEFNSVLKTVVAECGKVVLGAGNSVQTSVTAAMSDDSFYDIENAEVSYSSNNPSVADVDENGLVTAKGPGVATITAEVTIEGKTLSDGYPLKVMADLTLAGIQIDGENIPDFSPDIKAYSYLFEDETDKMPEVTALPAAEGMNINISQGKSVPGTALISITDDITGQTGKYAVNFGTLSYSDPFEPTALNEKWSWVRENPDNWSLTETTGSISVTAQRGDIQGTVNNAENILLQSANTDWTAESRVVFSKRPRDTDQQGGIIAYQDDDNFIKLVYKRSSKGFMDNDEYIELLVEREGAQYSAASVKARDLVQDDLTIVFKIEKKGSIYTAYYATGGKGFELLGSTDVVLSDIKAGLLACNGEPTSGGMMNAVAEMMGVGDESEVDPLKVRFDYFNITNSGR